MIKISDRWFTFVATIELVDYFTSTKRSSHSAPENTMISTLIVVRLLPNLFLNMFGGILVDIIKDRRRIMIVLSIVGSLVVLLYIHAKSVNQVFLIALSVCTHVRYDVLTRVTILNLKFRINIISLPPF